MLKNIKPYSHFEGQGFMARWPIFTLSGVMIIYIRSIRISIYYFDQYFINKTIKLCQGFSTGCNQKC